MIKRLYIDNYKCLVNFEYHPSSFQLLFGENGTGKSAVFEILEKLRNLVWLGMQTEQLFHAWHLTAWDLRRKQTFELELVGNGGTYSYRLIIEHLVRDNKNRVAEEELGYNGGRLYFFDGHEAHLFRDDHSSGPVFPTDWSRSGLASLPARDDNQLLTWFKIRMSNVFFFALDPWRMSSQSEKEHPFPERSLANFASWYRSLAQTAPEIMAPLFKALSEVLPDFKALTLHPPAGDTKVLLARFGRETSDEETAKEYLLNLVNLSEGQRCLIALYTILYCVRGSGFTICLDEPDNFLALRELQPWLQQFRDRIEEMKSQCLVISHHPELINDLAVDDGVRFTRTVGGPVRIRSVDWSAADGITPAEIVARAWDS